MTCLIAVPGDVADDLVKAHLLRNIFQAVKSEVLECIGRVSADLLEDWLASEDRGRLGSFLYPGCYVDTISDEVIARDNNVCEVNTYPQWELGLPPRAHFIRMIFPLNLDTTAHSVHGAGKLRQGRIPCR